MLLPFRAALHTIPATVRHRLFRKSEKPGCCRIGRGHKGGELMVKRSFAILMGTASAIALGTPVATLAQTTDQPAASSASGIEEVVVTARRREERAQTVPITLTTVSEAQMQTQQ